MAETTTVAPRKRKTGKVQSKDIQEILDHTDWDQYWEDVSEQVAKDVHGYAIARAKSLESAARRVVL